MDAHDTTTQVTPHVGTPHATVCTAEFERAEYVNLTTFRADGRAVGCPVWFAWSDDGATFYLRSKRDTAKVRRIMANASVRLEPCGWRGRVADGAPLIDGVARILAGDDPTWARADRALRRRYGWRWNSIPLFRVPFTNTVETDLSLRQKIGRIRRGEPLPGSCLIAVDLVSGREREASMRVGHDHLGQFIDHD
ncbi:MAG: PPOX class F420-dependent oxidoreductase [Ilumatobacteraceae bacterium]